MLFEAMHPLLQGIGPEKLCDVFGKTVDFLQKMQDESLDQDLLHSMQDTPDAVRNRIIAELFGFPIGPHVEKECESRKGPTESKKGKTTEKKADSKCGHVYPTIDLQKLNDELLNELSGSSKETLEDVRARVFGRKRAAAPEEGAAAAAPEPNDENVPGEGPKRATEEKIAKPEMPESEQTIAESAPEPGPENLGAPVSNDGYEWRFPVEKWCDPKDADVTVKGSTITLKVCKKQTNPENKVTTLKTLDFSVDLPADAVSEEASATFNEENSEFILRAPKRKPQAKGLGRAIRINFLQS